jgi:hypothetical protein
MIEISGERMIATISGGNRPPAVLMAWSSRDPWGQPAGKVRGPGVRLHPAHAAQARDGLPGLGAGGRG